MAYGLQNKKQKVEAPYSLEKKGYNGWTNYETWLVALNIDNEQGTYEASRDAIKSGEIHDGESYKMWFKENTQYNEEFNSYKLSDSWSDRELEVAVNWDELFKSHKKEIDEA